MEEKLNDQMLIRRGKLEKIAALGFEPYGGKYECTHHSAAIFSSFPLRISIWSFSFSSIPKPPKN